MAHTHPHDCLVNVTTTESDRGWMSHLSQTERKNWSRVISRDMKRQMESGTRPRPHSRAYSSGSSNGKKRRRTSSKSNSKPRTDKSNPDKNQANPTSSSSTQQFGLEQRVRSAIRRVNGPNADISTQANTVINGVRTQTFRNAFENQLRTDISRLVNANSDFRDERDQSRYAATREWLEGDGKSSSSSARSSRKKK